MFLESRVKTSQRGSLTPQCEKRNLPSIIFFCIDVNLWNPPDSIESWKLSTIIDPAASQKIDWAAFRTSACGWTIEELSHCSRCRVGPYVIAVARVLCSTFDITAGAREEAEGVRWKLRTAREDSSDHVLQMLTSGDDGLVVLAICGSLNDYFHWMALAEFFETLAESSGMPQAMRPARGRWMELARIAGKIQLPESFHKLVQKYSQLGLANVTAYDDLEEGVGPIGVVELLQGMSDIHSGRDDGRIMMFCGRGAGWYAAVAEWVFGLRIKLTIRDGTTLDGETLYSNCKDEEVQLIVAFNNPGVPCEGEPVDDLPMPTKR